jgi:hypothetical protein
MIVLYLCFRGTRYCIGDAQACPETESERVVHPNAAGERDGNHNSVEPEFGVGGWIYRCPTLSLAVKDARGI